MRKTPHQSLPAIVVAIVFAIMIFVVFSCKPQPSIENVTENVTVASTENISTEYIAEFGDLLTINFVLKLEDGTIVDTNNPELAIKANLTDYVAGPYKLILGQSGKIPGFDKALVGLKLGEKAVKTIEPTEKELYLDANITKVIPRIAVISRNQRFKLESFKRLFKKPPIINDVVFNNEFQWPFKVLNFTNETVLAQIFVREGESYQLPDTMWNSTVLSVGENTISFFQNPPANLTIETEFGPAIVTANMSRIFVNYKPELGRIVEKSIPVGPISIKQKFQIVDVSDEKFTLKRVSSLADKKLILEVELLELVKGVKDFKKEDLFGELVSIN